ncbi:MAG: SBDS family ribosome assembly factor [Candidatus Njordarchaeales archaeon]
MSSFRGERKKLDLGKYSLVVLEMGGKKFEIIVDPRAALKYYKQEAKPDDAIIIYEVYYDAQKGTRASIEDLRKLVTKGAIEQLRERKGELSRDEIEKIRSEVEELDEDKIKELASKYILKKGVLKLPKELRDELLEKKKRRIISYIQKYAINPATNAPYPPSKITEALHQVLSGEKIEGQRIRIMLDPLKEIDEELPAIINALKMILPIRLEIITVRIRIPPQYAGPLFSRVQKFGTIKESKWLDDGSWEALVEVPGGQFMQFHKMLTDQTHGNLKLEIIERRTIG